MSLQISQIRTDGGTQSRAAINAATVVEYAEQMQDEATVFPPVIVYFDGKDYWLADGFHRLEAWRQIGRDEVPADVRQGDRRSAILHSCGANAAHGLRRTDDDKRRAVVTLLEDAEWSQWSDREIARRVRVSPTTVAKYRAEVSGVTVQMDSEPRTYTTKHGTTAQMDTTNIGKPKAMPVEPASKTSDISGADKAGISVADAAGGPAQDTPKDPVRASLSALTREGLEDELIGLREENAELRKRVRSQTGQIADLKQAVKELGEGNDLGKALAAKVRELQAAKLARDDALAAAKRMEYRLKKAEARVEELQQMGVQL